MRAGLPWYRVPGSEDLHDRLWSFLRRFLQDAGFDSARLPQKLDSGDIRAVDDLLFTQTCGFDIAAMPKPLPWRIVGAFGYGGRRGTYTSYIMARADSALRNLQELAGHKPAANDLRSYSGFHVFGTLLEEPLVSLRERVRWTGSHLESLRCLRTGEAEFAAIDTVTHDLLRKFAPDTMLGLRILAESAPVPAPPIVTSLHLDEADVIKLRAAFDRLFTEEDARPLREALLLSGFYPMDPEDYRALLQPSAGGAAGMGRTI
jgi:hypothetical protein